MPKERNSERVDLHKLPVDSIAFKAHLFVRVCNGSGVSFHCRTVLTLLLLLLAHRGTEKLPYFLQYYV